MALNIIALAAKCGTLSNEQLAALAAVADAG
jgi:hypothetical protein